MQGPDEREIVIIGAGGHGSEILSYAHDLAVSGEKIRLLGFIDEVLPRGSHRSLEVLGGLNELKAMLDSRGGRPLYYITALGDNRARTHLVARLNALGESHLVPWSLRHPTASVGRDVLIGEGTCLAPGSIVTTRASIGRHGILNVKASVSHDCVIGDYVNLNPGATVAGNVRIGEGSFIGAGATVINKVTIGAWSIIGAGAVVIRDIPDRVTAVGVPCRVIKHHST